MEAQDSVREALDIALSEAGFQVMVRWDATAATDELNRTRPFTRAVITDVGRGDVAGAWDVAHRDRELVEEIPIIYINGEGTHDWFVRGVRKSVLVAKPFLPAQVVAAVLTLMNTRNPETIV